MTISHQDLQLIKHLLLIASALSWVGALVSFVGMSRSIKPTMDNKFLFQNYGRLVFFSNPEILTDNGLVYRQVHIWSIVAFAAICLLIACIFYF